MDIEQALALDTFKKQVDFTGFALRKIAEDWGRYDELQRLTIVQGLTSGLQDYIEEEVQRVKTGA